jgi:hypothetical protein
VAGVAEAQQRFFARAVVMAVGIDRKADEHHDMPRLPGEPRDGLGEDAARRPRVGRSPSRSALENRSIAICRPSSTPGGARSAPGARHARIMSAQAWRYFIRSYYLTPRMPGKRTTLAPVISFVATHASARR